MSAASQNNEHLRGRKINIRSAEEIKFWCAQLNCEQNDLVIAVMKIGNDAKTVDDFLILNRRKISLMPNKNTLRQNFSEDIVEKVWEKGEIISGRDPKQFRKDKCGALIMRSLFGANEVALSPVWQIDHIKPVSQGGTDDLVNLQPLQWENNRHKADHYPSWECYVTARGERNKYLQNIK